MITSDLYNKIINKEFYEIDKVIVLSGYASGSFLERVMDKHPTLNLELFIGMSHEGISYSSHLIFSHITKSNPNVNVYYQVKGNPNHMKIYSLFECGNHKKTLIGSANFTENGFEHNQEILTRSYESLEKLFENQKALSLLCTHDDIGKYINIYNKDIQTNEIVPDEPNREEQHEGNASGSSLKDYEKMRYNRLLTIKNKSNYKFLNEFDIEIIKANERNWASRGINSLFSGQEPRIPIGPSNFNNKVFPYDKELCFETLDNQSFIAISSLKYKGDLIFKDLNIYNYLKNKTGIKGNRPISRYDLDQANLSRITFIRMDEFKYYIEFY